MAGGMYHSRNWPDAATCELPVEDRPVPGSVSIVDMPSGFHPARLPGPQRARFLVTIDTEDEFDWTAPFRREGHGLASVGAFARFIDFCHDFGVVPVFLIDYPIATDPDAVAVLQPALVAGKAEVGIHLHPWVNPPFGEVVNEHNSFAGNLPVELERAKVLALRDAIAANLDTAPLIYRAGRYGAGPNTPAILREAGVPIDTSVRALFDYGAEGGPDYADHPRHPYWLDRDRGLLELPITSVHTGALRRQGTQIYPRLGSALRSGLARTRLLERVPLTPEGTSPAEALRAIDTALDEALPLLVFAFHSPSLAPGHTPYVRNAADLEAFYGWWREVFAHLATRGVPPTTVREIADMLALA
jgi:hypothetical protein